MPKYPVRVPKYAGICTLYGWVEQQPPERLHRAVGLLRGTHWEPEFSDAVLTLIADEHEREPEAAISEAHRFVQGEFRAKSRGPSSTLGDFGEFLSLLLLRSRFAHVERVFGASDRREGDRSFYRPDYFVEGTAGLGVVEVKSRLALDVSLFTGRRYRLKFCDPLRECREEALDQLHGNHQLRVKGGRLIPFPSDFGAAVGVLARDGRAEGMDRERVHSLPKCRERRRDCWGCFTDEGGAIDVLTCFMHNAPENLPLIRPTESSRSWMHRHRILARALWGGRDIDVAQSLQELLVALSDHASADGVLRIQWQKYLAAALLDSHRLVPEIEFFDVETRGTGPALYELSGPEAVERSLWEPQRFIVPFAEGPLASARFESDGRTFKVRGLPQVWREAIPLSEVLAQQIARRVLSVAAGVGGMGPEATEALGLAEVPLQAHTLRVGDSDPLLLGWALDKRRAGTLAWLPGDGAYPGWVYHLCTDESSSLTCRSFDLT